MYQPLQYPRKNPGMIWECHFSGSTDAVKLENKKKEKNYICWDQEEPLSSYLQKLPLALYIASVQWSRHWCKRNDFSLAFSMLEMKATWCRLSVKLSSATQSRPTLCDSMDCSTPGLPVDHQLPEFTQTHVHDIQPSHPLSSPSPLAFNLSKHQDLFPWVSSLHQVAKVLEFQLQHQSYQWTPRTDLL